jgi:nucleoside-diphosphate-sugar epimerase
MSAGFGAVSDGEPVVVIGANGFVGARLVRVLAATAGLRPVIAARRPPAGAANVEVRICDATDAAAVATALAGAACVVNCVAADGPTMQAATTNICTAAVAAGVRRVVHLSSMAVYGPATGLVDERHPLDGSLGWYAAAKVASEEIVQGYVAQGGDAVILRPGIIHGAGSQQWTGRIGRLLRQHRIGDLGAAGDGICNLIANDDVAAAVVAAVQRPGLRGQAFNLGDPDPGTWNQYFLAFARAIGATPITRISARWLTIETKILAIPLKLGEIAATRAKLGRLPFEPLPRSLLGLWRQEIQLDHARADAELGFPRTPPAQAIADAAAWFRQQ